MELNIEVISVSAPETVPSGQRSYQQLEVAYRYDGKVQGKTLRSFVNPSVFKEVQTWKQGDNVVVTAEKDAKGYWQWVSIGGNTTSSTPTKPATAGQKTSNYETREERLLRQQHIIRQNCVGNAVEFHSYAGGKGSAAVTVDQVLGTAAKLELWINKAFVPQAAGELEGDKLD